MDKLPKGTEYRAKSGNRAGVASAGCEVALGDSVITVNSKVYTQIILSNYSYMIGMYVDRRLVVSDAQPQPQPGVTLTHTIEVYSDGSIKVDGNAYP